jgi:predicted phosphodiesterase
VRLLLSGDVHGDLKSVEHKIDMAVKHGVQRILVLGDFRALVGV